MRVLHGGYPLDRQAIEDAYIVARRLGVSGKGRSRERRPTLDELDQLMEHFGQVKAKRPASIPMQKIIAFAIFSILMVKLVRNSSVHPGLYFICFALVVDFHRGDFAGTFYALTFVGGAYAFMWLVSRIRWAPSRFAKRAVSPTRTAPVLRS